MHHEAYHWKTGPLLSVLDATRPAAALLHTLSVVLICPSSHATQWSLSTMNRNPWRQELKPFLLCLSQAFCYSNKKLTLPILFHIGRLKLGLSLKSSLQSKVVNCFLPFRVGLEFTCVLRTNIDWWGQAFRSVSVVWEDVVEIRSFVFDTWFLLCSPGWPRLLRAGIKGVRSPWCP